MKEEKVIIDIKNLQKQYCNNIHTLQIFDGINLSILKNQITTIVGPSGCGKTTLLNIISELDMEYKGHIHKNIKNLVGYIFQKDALIPWKTVSENILLGTNSKKEAKQKKESCLNFMRDYGLYKYKNYFPGMLSGGMRQKVALAQMLINNPDLILLDEPFSSQDFFTKIQLENLFYKDVKSKQLSAILVTHDIEEAIALSDRIIVFSQKPCRVLKDITLNFRNEKDFLLPERVRETASISDYFADIYQTLKPELNEKNI